MLFLVNNLQVPKTKMLAIIIRHAHPQNAVVQPTGMVELSQLRLNLPQVCGLDLEPGWLEVEKEEEGK